VILQLTNRKRLFPHQTPGLNDELINRWYIRPVKRQGENDRLTPVISIEVQNTRDNLPLLRFQI
jgi:hypothetical protein